MRGMNEVALADYHHAVELGAATRVVNPRLAAVHYAIALELYNQMDYSGTSIECSRAVSYNNIVPDYFVTRAKAYLGMASPEMALDDLQKALAINNTHEEANRMICSLKPPVQNIPLNIQKLMYRKSRK